MCSVGTLTNLERKELPIYKISSMPSGKMIAKTIALGVDKQTIQSKGVPDTKSELYVELREHVRFRRFAPTKNNYAVSPAPRRK